MYRLILLAIAMLPFEGCYKTVETESEELDAGIIDTDGNADIDTDTDADNDTDKDVDTEPDVDTGLEGEGEPCLADIQSVAYPSGICLRPGSRCEGGFISELSSLSSFGIQWSSNCPTGLDCCMGKDQCDIHGSLVGDVIHGLFAACHEGPCPTEDFLVVMSLGCPNEKPNCCVQGPYPY